MRLKSEQVWAAMPVEPDRLLCGRFIARRAIGQISIREGGLSKGDAR
jgi:hypothetical protein